MQQKPSGSQNLKYLFTGPLQKKFTNCILVYRISFIHSKDFGKLWQKDQGQAFNIILGPRLKQEWGQFPLRKRGLQGNPHTKADFRIKSIKQGNKENFI